MQSKKTILTFFAVIFGILTLVFYFTSIREVDRDTARYLGVSAVANVQGTVFAGACAVLCGVNVAAAMIIGAMEEINHSSGPSAGYVANEVARAIKKNEDEEKRKQAEEAALKREKEEREEKARQRVEELKAKRENGGMLDEEVFLEQISDETSMLKIWNIWEEKNLGERNPEADAFIQKYKDAERLYGKLSNIEKIKEELKHTLLS